MKSKRDAAFILFVILVVSGTSYIIGWEYGKSTAPAPTVTRQITEVAPPECLRALAIADRELALAADLSLVMSQVAPLVDDAYEAGLDGDRHPAVIARAKRVNERYRELWGRLGVLPNTRAKIANECENATP